MPTPLLVTQQLTTKAQLDIGVYLQLLHGSASFSFLPPCRFFVLLFSSFPTSVLSLTPVAHRLLPTPPHSRRLPTPPILRPSASFLFRSSFPTVPDELLVRWASSKKKQNHPTEQPKRPLEGGPTTRNEFSALLTTYTATKANKHIIG